MKTVEMMGYDIFSDDVEKISITDNKRVINTINAHAYIVSKDDLSFQEALKESDILLPDGSGIVLAVKQIQKKEIKKIAGADIHNYLLESLNKTGGRVFYMGAAEKTLNAIHKRVHKEYPAIEVASYSPPYKPEFSDEENEMIISKVNAFDPDILFIGMTAPKQEKWLHTHKTRLNFKIASSIGAVFDFYAGTVQRPSEFWINLHLEWLPRLLKEPKRLWRRNFISTPLFMWETILFKLKIKR